MAFSRVVRTDWPKFDDLLVQCRTCEPGDRIVQPSAQQPLPKPDPNRHRQTMCFYSNETPTVLDSTYHSVVTKYSGVRRVPVRMSTTRSPNREGIAVAGPEAQRCCLDRAGP